MHEFYVQIAQHLTAIASTYYNDLDLNKKCPDLDSLVTLHEKMILDNDTFLTLPSLNLPIKNEIAYPVNLFLKTQ